MSTSCKTNVKVPTIAKARALLRMVAGNEYHMRGHRFWPGGGTGVGIASICSLVYCCHGVWQGTWRGEVQTKESVWGSAPCGLWSVPLCGESVWRSGWCMGSWSVPLWGEARRGSRLCMAHGLSHCVIAGIRNNRHWWADEINSQTQRSRFTVWNMVQWARMKAHEETLPEKNWGGTRTQGLFGGEVSPLVHAIRPIIQCWAKLFNLHEACPRGNQNVKYRTAING